MNKVKATIVAISIGFSAIVCAEIPKNLPWPIDGKKVNDTTFFFGVDDSVLTPEGSLKCNNGRFRYHLGVDIKANVGTPVKAIADGEVYTAKQTGWGEAIIISHGNWGSNYWHIKPTVSAGQTVIKGQTIGTVISTENMNDVNHLHLGIYDGGGKNPKGYSNGFKAGCANVDEVDKVFKNPYHYLVNSKHFILDDAGNKSTHRTWNVSTSPDFYYGSGYRYADLKKEPDAAIRLKSGDFQSDYRYDVYLRLTPSSEYTSNAYYELNIYGSDKSRPLKTVKTSYNQRATIRGDNHLLFSNIDIKRGQSVDIVVKNNGGTGEKLAVDAFIFVAK